MVDVVCQCFFGIIADCMFQCFFDILFVCVCVWCFFQNEEQQVFCKTGFCRHQVVAVRTLHTANVELTRQMAIEFRQVIYTLTIL